VRRDFFVLLAAFFCLSFVAAAPLLDPSYPSGVDGLNWTMLHRNMSNAQYMSGNVTRIVNGSLVVPWYLTSTGCLVSDLQSGSNCNIGTVNRTQYCEVSDEHSVKVLDLSMEVDGTKWTQAINSLSKMLVNKGTLPGWRCLVNESTNLINCGDSRTNSNNDTASDATARYIQALFIAANNTAFSATTRGNASILGINMTIDSLSREVVNTCYNSTLGYGNICYWMAGGSNAKTSGLGGGSFTYSGYFGDYIEAMMLAYKKTSNNTYLLVARNVTLQYLQSAYPPGYSLAVNGFRVSPGKNFHYSNLTGTPVAVCDDTCGPDQWDSVDAARGFTFCEAVYNSIVANISLPALAYQYCGNWSVAKMSIYNSLPIQYYANGTNSASNQSGYWAQGLQAWGLLSTQNASKVNATLTSCASHYNEAIGKWDYTSCTGVYTQQACMKAIGTAIGLTDNAYSGVVSSGGSSDVIVNFSVVGWFNLTPLVNTLNRFSVNTSVGVVGVWAQIVYPNGSVLNRSLSNVTPTIFFYNEPNNQSGTYNASIVFANSTTGNITSNNTGWSFISYNLSSAWCFQEWANISTSCGGLDTGIYRPLTYTDALSSHFEWCDGDYGTSSYGDVDPQHMNFNYTVPVGTQRALLQLSDGILRNYTIPSSCLVTGVLAITSSRIFVGTYGQMFYCAGVNITPKLDRYIYEEGMWWNSFSVTFDFNVSINNVLGSDSIGDVCLVFSNVNGSDTFCGSGGSIVGSTWVNPSNVSVVFPDVDFYNVSVGNVDLTVANFSVNVTPSYYFNVSYGGFNIFGGINYTRNLSFVVGYYCPSYSSSYLFTLINGVVVDSDVLSCSDNISVVHNDNFVVSQDGLFNISFLLNDSVGGVSDYSVNSSFFGDVNNPVIISNLSSNAGFVSGMINTSVFCSDNVSSNLTYNVSLNGASLFFGNVSNGTTINNVSVAVGGINTLSVVCSDLFGSSSSTDTLEVAYNQVCLIDERLNVLFDSSNISRSRVYIDDNSSYYDFKVSNTSCVNFTGTNITALRFDLGYADGSTVTRFIDTSLLDGGVRVCANPEGVTHEVQYLLSGSLRPVFLRSVFSNCYVGADRTRFAYQDSFLLKAFTINGLYNLYVYDDGDQVFLGSIDGSIGTYVNIDTLEFQSRSSVIDLSDDGLYFDRPNPAADQVRIYYKNNDADNVAVSLTVTRMDTDVVVLSNDDFADPNEFTVYFDYTLLENVNETVVFKATVEKTNDDGDVDSFSKYFNTGLKTGLIASGVAFALALLFTIFGLTFASLRITFGWFGILVMVASIVILAAAISTWYINVMMAIDFIVLVYIILMMNGSSSPVVA